MDYTLYGDTSVNRKTICPECGKICLDKKTAISKKNWLMKRGKQTYLRVYQCGDSWHLTSKELNNDE